MPEVSELIRTAGSIPFVHSFFHDDKAAGVVEYALILGLVAVAVIVAMVFFRDQLGTLFGTISNNVAPQGGGSPSGAACVGPQQLGQCP
jgi:Flp pilus assembly pilin Flp